MIDLKNTEVILDSHQRLSGFIENEGFLGWDPHDALNAPVLRKLAGNNRLLGILFVQLLKRSPINFRKILGVQKGFNPKGMGLFLVTYLQKYQLFQKSDDLQRINFFSTWLQENISRDYSGACWGYDFDWPNRSFFAPKGTPTVVNTAFIALAMLELYRLLGDEKALGVARSACDFILKDLSTIRPQNGELCFSYTPIDQRYIHNANLMGAQLLAEVHAITGEKILAEYAHAAAMYSVRRQLADGSWWYGEAKKENWIDNFHTGFVLNALKKISQKMAEPIFQSAIERGYLFWKESFFLENGAAKYYANQIYPIDSHSVAQGILTFLEYRDVDSDAVALAHRTALWGIENMQDKSGYFYYQVHRNYKNKIPYIRWSQAWLQRALTELIYVT